MSNELKLIYQGEATDNLYCFVHVVETGKVLNVVHSTKDTWNAANLAEYDVPITQFGGPLWSGNFPNWLTANTDVIITYYKRLGAAPAITDTLLQTDERTWNGTTLVSTQTVTLTPSAGAAVQPITVFIPGIIDENTNATNEDRLQVRVPISSAGTCTVQSVAIPDADLPVSNAGTTTMVVSDAEWDGGGTSTITVSLGPTDSFAAAVAGGITKAANVPVWIYFTSHGNHGNLMVRLEFVPAGGAVSTGIGLGVAEVVNQVRKLVGDAVSPYRVADSVVMDYVESAQLWVLGKRSDLAWDSDGTIDTDSENPTVTSLGHDLFLGRRQLMAVAYYAASIYCSGINPDTTNAGLAKIFYSRACQELGVAE